MTPQELFANKTFKASLLGAGFFVLIIIIHMIFSYFIDDKQILRALRPYRDALFFPMFVVVDNTSEIYCKLSEFGITDYKRCLIPTEGKIPLPDGPTKLFRDIVGYLSMLFAILYYTVIFKVIIYLKSKYYRTKNVSIRE